MQLSLRNRDPAVAIDHIIVFEAEDKALYATLITRKNDPGKGKPALVGGFVEIEDGILQPGHVTLENESKEEAGVRVTALLGKKDRKRYDIWKFRANFEFFDNSKESIGVAKGTIVKLGNYCTTAEEDIVGGKRVYGTSAYVGMVSNESLRKAGISVKGEADVRKLVTAGDDASSVIILDISKLASLNFGIGHHKIISQDAQDYITHEGRRYFGKTSVWTKIKDYLQERWLKHTHALEKDGGVKDKPKPLETTYSTLMASGVYAIDAKDNKIRAVGAHDVEIDPYVFDAFKSNQPVLIENDVQVAGLIKNAVASADSLMRKKYQDSDLNHKVFPFGAGTVVKVTNDNGKKYVHVLAVGSNAYPKPTWDTLKANKLEPQLKKPGEFRQYQPHI